LADAIASGTKTSFIGHQKENKMFSLTIAVGNTSWAFMFKTQENLDNAKKALYGAYGLDNDVFNTVKQTTVYVTDDFGQHADLVLGSIHGFVAEDLSLSKHAHIERALQQARTHAEAQTAWQNDPVARAAARGPSVLAPGMMTNGRFPQ
jgi:hypothetical protein